MIESNPTLVNFLRVVDNPSKLQKLCEITKSYFLKKEKVLIIAPSNEAASFIDQLLWKMPEESFIPHSIAHSLTKEAIAITTTTLNVNHAKIIFNLSQKIPLFLDFSYLIYELLDLTSPEKEKMSRQKQDDYQNLGYQIKEIF